MSVVLDASAVLALLFREKGADLVAVAARRSLLCAVNVDEVLHKNAARGIPPATVERQLAALEIRIVPFGLDHARAAAHLHAFQKRGISFADRACLALAQAERLPVLTSDQAWASLDLGVDIRLIR